MEAHALRALAGWHGVRMKVYPPSTKHLPLSARGQRQQDAWAALSSEERLAPGVAWIADNKNRIALLEAGKLSGVARRREVRRGIQTRIDWSAAGIPELVKTSAELSSTGSANTTNHFLPIGHRLSMRASSSWRRPTKSN